jgi:hypothetical protein
VHRDVGAGRRVADADVRAHVLPLGSDGSPLVLEGFESTNVIVDRRTGATQLVGASASQPHSPVA